MKALTVVETMQMLAKLSKKWCMYINAGEFDNFDDLMGAAPYLNIDDHMQILADCVGILLFDSKEEMEDHYQRTVGDDGPTKLNPYNGKGRWYALTCGPDGKLINENT